MKKNSIFILIAMLTAFVLWTLAVCFVDVKAIGPDETTVGLATVNEYFHKLTGVNFSLYALTDWLGLVPVFTSLSFGLLGLIQWICRKHISRVDYSIFVLGGFYFVVLAVYLFFEKCVVNYRPVLINGILEASYPSSTTLLVLCVMPTAAMQLNSRIKNKILRLCLTFLITAFVVFMVVGRLLSGVHWLTDIIGGIILSTLLVMLYRFVIEIRLHRKKVIN